MTKNKCLYSITEDDVNLCVRLRYSETTGHIGIDYAFQMSSGRRRGLPRRGKHLPDMTKKRISISLRGKTAGDKNVQWIPRVKCVCEYCGQEYETTIYQKDKGRRFCSFECQHNYQRGKNNPKYKPCVDVICIQCGRVVKVLPHKVQSFKYCSNKCHSDSMRGKRQSDWVKIICKNCGKEFEVRPSRSDIAQFCSLDCRNEYKRGENSPMWKNGASFEPYCPKFNESFKEDVRAKYDRKCFLCGKSEEDNGQKLSVHHVNYDKSCLCNEIDCEFVPLCKRCHGKTNGNVEYWEAFIMKKLEDTQ